MTAGRAGRRTGRMRRISRRLAYYLPAIAVFLGGILLWELLVRAFRIERFLLPAPSAIAAKATAPRSTVSTSEKTRCGNGTPASCLPLTTSSSSTTARSTATSGTTYATRHCMAGR